MSGRWTLATRGARGRGARAGWVLSCLVGANCGPEHRAECRPADATPLPTHGGIILDSRFDDWTGAASTQDPPGDAGDSGVDMLALAVASDNDAVYLRLTFANDVKLDDGHALTLVIDSDDDAASGAAEHCLGGELVWQLAERVGRLSLARAEVYDITQANIGIAALPSTTATDFELVIDRHATDEAGRPLFAGPQLALAVADGASGDRIPDRGALRVVLADDEPVVPGPLDLDKAPGTFRVVTFNTLIDGLADERRLPAFQRIIEALAPDVLHLQEAMGSAQLARDLLDEWLPLASGSWSFVRLDDRVTLSRFAIEADAPTSVVSLDENILVAALRRDDMPVVSFNAHLSCCDKDLARQNQADSFIAYLRAMRERIAADTPFYLVGDLNLVGSAGPLATMLSGDVADDQTFGPDSPPDWDGTGLVDALPLQLGTNRATTWQAPLSRFWPGRLDYVLYSDATLAVSRAFVLSTAVLPGEALAAFGLEPDDSAVASDHLPVVVDFVVR